MALAGLIDRISGKTKQICIESIVWGLGNGQGLRVIGINEKDKKHLGWKSGDRCAISTCRRELIIDTVGSDSSSIIGEMAHIKGENPGSARYDPNMTDKERNSYSNLILLCNVCHKIVDDNPTEYTVEKIQEIKRDHEKYIRESTAISVIDVTAEELNIVTKYLISNQPSLDTDYRAIPPKDKIERNGLSTETEQLITLGMNRVELVRNFINRMNQIMDPDFGDRLKEGFVKEYHRLRIENHRDGDEIFEDLFDYASRNSGNFLERAAGLTVLAYLFEECEVFEK